MGSEAIIERPKRRPIIIAAAQRSRQTADNSQVSLTCTRRRQTMNACPPTRIPWIIRQSATGAELYPFASHFVTVGGHRLHYLDEGPNSSTSKTGRGGHAPCAVAGGEEESALFTSADGTRSVSATAGLRPATLLFVHGNPTWSFHWRRFISAFRSQYRCIAVDHLGCGLSEKPPRYLTLSDHIANLATLVEQLNLVNITLIAQDWGGAIGLGACSARPSGSAESFSSTQPLIRHDIFPGESAPVACRSSAGSQSRAAICSAWPRCG